MKDHRSFRSFPVLLTGLTVLLSACGAGTGQSPTLSQGRSGGLTAQDIATTAPAGVAGGPISQNGELLTPYVTANGRTKGAVPTNKFWSSLVFKRFKPERMHSENMFAHPLAMQAKAGGLGISYPNNLQIVGANGNSKFQYPYTEDFTMGVQGLNAPDTRADDWSDWTVTAAWDDGTRSLRATFGHGLPFVYATTSGGNAQVSFNAAPTVFSNQGNVLGVTVNGRSYGIFAPTGATWSQSGNIFTSSLAGKNYYSVASLPDGSVTTLNDYKQYAYNFVTGTRVNWSYNAASGTVSNTYTVTTTPKEGTGSGTLMGLYRHQWLNSGSVNTGYTYVSPRGQMKVVRGSSFTTNMKFNGTLPWLPTPGTANTAQLNGYVNEVANAPDLFPYRGDSYWAGKSLGRVAELVPIAEQVGNTAARDKFVAGLKTYLQDWFDGQNPNVFYYNSTWGTLIGYPKGFGSEEELNDHHFHWGYFIQAAAIVAQYDPNWLTAENGRWKNTVNELIKDVANIDDANKRYPRLRSFDVYAGHSWASGHSAFAAGNNQESSSEDMHFANALILWGAVTNDTATRDMGISMYTNEVNAIEQYWFDVNDQTFPANYPHPVVGMVWGDGGDYSTWFSGEKEMIQGINLLPINAGSLYLGRNPDYIKKNYDYLGREPQSWRDIFWEFYALYDAPGALAKFGSGAYTPEEGESRAHTYHWISSLNTLGRLDTAVTGNIPTSAVFNKNGTRNYAAYNPGSSAITVTYSDGKTMNVPARSNVLNGSGGGGGDTQAPTVPANLSSPGKTSSSVNLAWSASNDNVGVTAYDVLVNGAVRATVSGTTATVSGLSANTAYTFSVRARDAAGNTSAASAGLSVTTSTASTTDTQAPTVPANLSSPGKTSSSVNLAWSASSDNVGVTAYDVLVNGAVRATVSGTTANVTGLSASTAYTFSVRAKDAAGNTSAASAGLSVTTSAGSTTDTQAPTVPANLTSPSKTSTSITLSWGASTDNVGVAGYDIYRSGIKIASSTTTSFTDSNLNPSTPYVYTVRARDAANNSSADSNGVNVTTSASGTTADTQAPTAPANLTSPSKTATSVNLSWGASTDNVGVTGYNIFRNGTQIGTVTGTGVTVTGLTAGTAYSFSVRARDAAGNTSAASNTVNVTTNAASTAIPGVISSNVGALAGGTSRSFALTSGAAANFRILVTSNSTVNSRTLTVNLDGRAIQISISAGQTVPIDYAGVAAGNHTLTLTANSESVSVGKLEAVAY